MLVLLTDPNAWAALLTLTALEIVLGVDNVVFISLLAANLDPASSRRARQVGLLLALIFRVALLFALTRLGQLRYPLVVAFGYEISWRNIILIGGGLFLIAKATLEIHREIDVDERQKGPLGRNAYGIVLVILQITVIDLVFSIDSIVTAIGMAQHIEVMIAAVLIAVAVMYAASARRRLHRAASHDQDVGSVVLNPDRRRADCRRVRCPHPARIRLFRYGVCWPRRGIQHSRAAAARTTPSMSATVLPAVDVRCAATKLRQPQVDAVQRRARLRNRCWPRV
jgi:hypothetical protein